VSSFDWHCAGHSNQMHAIASVLTGVVREHDIGADQKADSQWPGLNDLESKLTRLIPNRLAIARGRIRNVLLRMDGLNSLLGRPNETLVAATPLALDRTTSEDNSDPELVERSDTDFVVRDRLLPSCRIE